MAAKVPDPMECEREHPRLTSAPEIDRRFLIYDFKVKPCTLDDCEGPDKCLFKHPGEQGRRDPSIFRYLGYPCFSYTCNGGSCPRGDACRFAHGLLEYSFHPKTLSIKGISASLDSHLEVYSCVAAVLPCERAAVQRILDLVSTGQICEEYEDDDILLYPSYDGTGNEMAISPAARDGKGISKHGHDDIPKTALGSIYGPKFLGIPAESVKLVLPALAETSTVGSRMPLVCAVDAWHMFGGGSAQTDPGHDMLVEPDDLKLDSGASNHVVGEKTLLQGYESLVRPLYIRVADGYPLEVVGIGSIVTKEFFIPNVYRVKGLQEDLISVSQLARDHGLFSGFHRWKCEVLKRDGEVVGGGILQANGMYKLRFLEVPEAEAEAGYENA